MADKQAREYIDILVARMEWLERRVHALERASAQEPDAQGEAEPELPLELPAHEDPVEPAHEDPVEPGPRYWAPPVDVAAESLEPVAQRGERKISTTWLGGNWLARIGVLVLGLGVVFFLSLAWENNWVPRWGRIALGVGAGAALFILGEWLRERHFNPRYSQILQGGGAVIGYASLYVAYALPAYRADLQLTLSLSISLLAAWAIAVGFWAWYRNLPILAGIGIGLSTLLMAPAGEFSSLGVLVLGILGIAMLAAINLRRWSVLQLPAIVAYHASFFVATLYGSAPWELIIGCILVIDILIGFSLRVNQNQVVAGALVASFWLVSSNSPLGADSFALAGGLGLLAALLMRKLALGYAAVGWGLLLLWPMFAYEASLEGAAILGGFALVATLLATVPNSWTNGIGYHFGAIAAIAMGGLALLLAITAPEPHIHILGIIALALFAMAMALQARQEYGVYAIIPAGFIAVTWVPQQFDGTLIASIWLLIATLWIGLAGKQKHVLYYSAMGMLGLSLVALLQQQVVASHPTPLVYGIAVAIAAAALAAWANAQSRVHWFAAAIMGLTFSLVPLAQYQWGIGQALTQATIVAAISGAGLLWRHGRDELWLGAEVLAGVTTLALLLSTSHLGWIAALLVVAAMGMLWQGRQYAAPILWSAVLLAQSFSVLSGWQVTVSWALVALGTTLYASLRDDQYVRWVSLGIFGAVVAKVFLLDYRAMEQVARIVTFIATGVILLLAAFFFARKGND